MSSSKQTSPSQPAELSEYRERPLGSRSTPISCRVCDKVFFNNVQLVLHFECHLQEKEIPLPKLFFESGHLSLHPSPYSSTLKNMNKRLRPLPISSANVGFVDVPILNSMGPMNSSLWHHRFTSPSTGPLMDSQVGAGRSAPGLTHVTPLRLRGQNGRPGHPVRYKNPCMKQLEKRVPEIIVISDDEDENKKGDEIDLTLKL